MAEKKISKNQLEAAEIVDEMPTPAPAQVGAVWSESVNLPVEELSIPNLSLAQGLHPEVMEGRAKMGQWIMSGYEPSESVIIVPLRFGKSRSYATRDNGENKQHCYSPTGAEHGIGNPGIACADCALKEWTPSGEIVDGREKNNPPLCQEAFDFMCWSVEHETLVQVRFKSTGMKAGRLLAQLGKSKGLGNFAVKLEATKVQGKFTYMVPKVTVVSGEEAREAMEAGQAMLALNG